MKKITLMIFVSLMSFFAHAQLAKYEFDEPWVVPGVSQPASSAAPPDWVVINEFGPIYTWVQTTPGNTSQPPYGGSGHSAFLQKENVAPTAAIPSDWLITEEFPMIANAQLSFQSRLTIANDNGGIYKVYIAAFAPGSTVEVDDFVVGGTQLTTYTELTLDPLQTSQWTAKTFDIPASANYPVGSTVRIAFVMQGDDKDRWFLDDVQVSALCVAPTNPVLVSSTTTTASLSWTTSATSWEIEVVPDSAVPTGTGQIYNGGLPYVKAGLTACTNYKYYVRAKCADGGTSAWVGPVFFKTKCLGETCAEPLVIPPGNQSVSGNTSAFGDFYEGISGTGCGSTGNYLAGNDVVYTYTPDATGNYNILLSGTGGPAGLFIYSSCANIGVSCIGGGTASATANFNIPAFSMTAGTTYYFVISTNGTPQTTPYTLSIQQVFCPAPTAGTSTGITGTTATLGWTPGTVGATSWQLAVQPAGTGLPTTGSTVTSNTGNTVGGTTGASPQPFTPATSYEFYVRESCAGGQFSIWSGPFLFTTTQIPATLNFSQNFDAGAHGFTLNNGTQVNKWMVGSNTSNSPANSLYITNDNATNSFNIATTSVVQAYRDIQMPATIGQLALSFDWKAFGEQCCDYLRVWIVPATFTPTPGTQITAAADRMQIGGNLNVNGTWTNSLTIINAPATWNSQTMRLVFEWRNDNSIGSQPPAAIDNINLSVVTCPQPTALTIGSLTPTNAVINWTAPAIVPAQGYDVYWSNTATPAPTATTTPNQVSVPGTTTNIPLTADTFYYVWVRAHCSGTDQSFWTGPISFSTPQIPAAMDYSQNFDSATPHGFALSNGTQVNKWFVGGATFASAANSLYITNDNGVTNGYEPNTQAVVHAYRDIQIPAAVPSGQALLQFDWKALANTGDYMRVWVVPVTYTPTQGTQITAAASGGVQVGANFQGSTAWTTSNNVVTIPAGWLNTPRRVIFEWFNNAFTGNNPPAAVDNINFKVITCPAPTALTLGAVTTTTATLTWTAPASAPANYDVYYSTSTTPPTDATAANGGTPTTPTATISGLINSTNYNVWVRSNCGGAGTSFWIGPINFNTTQVPATTPYAQNFDAGAHSFALANGTQVNKWFVGPATFNSPANSLYVSNDGGVTNSYTITSTSVVHAYRDIQLPATIPSGQVLLKFDWKGQGESTFDYIRAWIVPVTFTPVTGTQITAAASGGVQVGGNYNLNGTTWTTSNNVVTAPASWNNTVRRVVFEWRNDGSGGTMPPGAIDNIEFSVITCPAPSALVLTSATENSAVVSWTAPGSIPADGYDYYYSTSATPPTAATIPNGNVSGTTATLSPLTDATNYNVWVRSNCVDADGNSFWIGPLNFTTPQIPATMPYNQNFDGTDNPAYTLNNGTQANKWVVGTATFNSPAKSMYISNDNGVTHGYNMASTSTVHAYRDIQLPASIPTNQVTVSFDWKNMGENNFDYIRVWVVPVTFSPTAGTLITAAADRIQLGGNLNNSANWTNVEHILNTTGLQGTVRRLVFEWRNDGSGGTMPPAAIDNISVKVLTCPKPTNLTVTNPTMTTATLGWTEAGSATAWEVYVVPVNDPAPTDATDGVDVDATTYLYEDLEAGTLYKYYVRAVCGPGDLSRWSGPFNFNTTICEPVDQCPVNFILTDSGNNGWGGTTMSVTQNGILIGTLGPQLTTGGGPVTVTLQMCKGLPYDVFFNTGGTSPAQAGLQIVNPFNNQTVFQRVAGSVNSDQNTLIYTGIAYCSDITCPQPTELVSESVVNAPNTTQLSWTPGGTETQWEVVIQAQGAGFPSADPATSVIVDEPSYVLANVLPGVPYEYYVRAICGDDDMSFWSGALKFSVFTPPACADVVIVDADLDIIAPDTEYVVCPGEDVCIDFDASYYVEAAETTSYEVIGIPFAPPFPTLGGTPMPVDQDDIWSPKITLPFEFCFMGNVYNSAQVGSNGIVSFNANQPAGGGSGYSFSQTIPNTTFPQLNAIYGVYQDTNPNPTNNTWDNPSINYQVLGNYPCRALVVSFNELAQFGCSTDSAADQLIGAQSSQIVIYEITNIIEVYVKRRVPCTSWQGGVGLIGVQNAAGDVAFTPPGRNTGAWSASEEAWRFTPNGVISTVNFEWLKDGAPYSTNTAINVCAEVGTTVMTARASYLLCNGNNVVRQSDFTIRVEEQIIPAADPVTISKCGNGEDVTFDLTVATADVFTDPTGYNFTFYPTEQDAIDETNAIATPEAFVTNATVTLWVRIMKDDLPCFITRSFIVEVSNVAPVFGITPDASICEGTSTTIAVVPDPLEDLTGATYSWTVDGNALPDTTDSITVTTAGSYVVTVNKNGCVGTATSVVTVVPMPVADAPADVTACDTYTLPALSADNNYYTGPGGTGTLLSAGDEITSAQTIYVYAVSPTLAACTAENSFVVTINVTPTLDDIDDVTACDSYVLEALSGNNAAANYYTGPAGTGTMLNAGDVITATQTIYIYQETGTVPNCSDEESFIVTITETPVADAPGDVTMCDSYALPALSAGNSYYTAAGGPNGGGTQLSAGDLITSTQLIYVYAAAAGNAACIDENAFTVNITATPQFNLGGPYVACLPTNVTVGVNGVNFNANDPGVSYVWTVNGAAAGSNSSTIAGTEFGIYEVTVTIGTCSHTESIEVSQDTTLIELEMTDSCETNVYTVTVSDVEGSFNTDTASYSWTGPEGFSSTERTIVPVALGEYVVTVTTADGCVSMDSFEVTSTACSIPKGISPNNDGYNDAFDLTTLDVKKLEIFNRYGQKVYSKNNYKKEWIGQGDNGDELPTGTYFYMVERSTGETITGWVYINRQD